MKYEKKRYSMFFIIINYFIFFCVFLYFIVEPRKISDWSILWIQIKIIVYFPYVFLVFTFCK